MKYLTIDTTTKVTALSLGEDGKLVGESFLHTGKTHSERLIPMLDQLMNAADWKLSELGFIGVVRGPGSFTGIRIGIATAQGLAQVLGIPLLGVTTLDAMAWAGRHRQEDTVVILDARKNEWYTARYRWTDKKTCIDRPRAARPQQLASELLEQNQAYYFVGDAVGTAHQELKDLLGDKAVIPDEYNYLPRGAYAASEAWEVWTTLAKEKDHGEIPNQACGVEPFYIRLSEAEVNYRKKQSANL